ncbi:hypothetical protein BC832DRAFT_596098 [Gaertneriomyces semiglobifer]|nr:hypothetical protein BC832DRAFT_596098 [Gaertneriomyces semiglobifer]
MESTHTYIIEKYSRLYPGNPILPRNGVLPGTEAKPGWVFLQDKPIRCEVKEAIGELKANIRVYVEGNKPEQHDLSQSYVQSQKLVVLQKDKVIYMKYINGLSSTAYDNTHRFQIKFRNESDRKSCGKVLSRYVSVKDCSDTVKAGGNVSASQMENTQLPNTSGTSASPVPLMPSAIQVVQPGFQASHLDGLRLPTPKRPNTATTATASTQGSQMSTPTPSHLLATMQPNRASSVDAHLLTSSHHPQRTEMESRVTAEHRASAEVTTPNPQKLIQPPAPNHGDGFAIPAPQQADMDRFQAQVTGNPSDYSNLSTQGATPTLRAFGWEQTSGQQQFQSAIAESTYLEPHQQRPLSLYEPSPQPLPPRQVAPAPSSLQLFPPQASQQQPQPTLGLQPSSINHPLISSTSAIPLSYLSDAGVASLLRSIFSTPKFRELLQKTNVDRVAQLWDGCLLEDCESSKAS